MRRRRKRPDLFLDALIEAVTKTEKRIGRNSFAEIALRMRLTGEWPEATARRVRMVHDHLMEMLRFEIEKTRSSQNAA